MATPGVLKWANDIRFAMVNDPARQKFKDEFNYRCRRYLEDFDAQIETILAGPAEDFPVDLLKTPGRNRVVSTKSKATPSTLRNITTFSLQEPTTKENLLPTNAFTKALLRAKSSPEPPSRSPLQESPRRNMETRFSEASLVTFPSNSAALSSSNNVSFDTGAEDVDMAPLPDPAYPAVTDLSMIAEDVEMEPSRMNTCEDPAVEPQPMDASVPASYVEKDKVPSRQSSLATTDSFRTVPLDAYMDPAPSSPIVDEEARPRSPSLVGSRQVHSPQQPAPSARTSSARQSPSPEAQDDTTDQSTHESLVPSVPDKANVPAFPPPEPMPLRKSTRAPREPEAADNVPAPPPIVQPAKPTLASKRASWLTRAKEIKALDGPLPPSPEALRYEPSTSANPLKRKSDTMNPPKEAGSPDEPPRKSLKTANQGPTTTASTMEEEYTVPLAPAEGTNDVLDQLRSTVARMGKSLGKSVGGTAASQALADARAAAEAKIAEPDNLEVSPFELEARVDSHSGLSNPPGPSSRNHSGPHEREQSSHDDRRLSLSDLISSRESQPRIPPPGPVFRPPPQAASKEAASGQPAPPRPVFTRPEKVFFPPDSPPKEQSKSTFQHAAFSRPAAMSVGLSPRLRSPSENKVGSPVGTQAQSTQDSVADSLFSSLQGGSMPQTQETEYSLMDEQEKMRINNLDEDDSWPLSEAGQPFVLSRTDDTWSTASHRAGDTGPLTESFHQAKVPLENTEDFTNAVGNNSRTVPGAFNDQDYDGDDDEYDDEPRSDDAVVIKPTVHLVQSQPRERSPSPPVFPSSPTPSQSQAQSSGLGSGFFNQATKFVSTVLGTGKKVTPKPEVKSLQLAAAAARKQHEEQERKDARLREMEARRQAALQRKAEEEKTRAQEEERRAREEQERRKKEKEDLTEKRALKTSALKKQDDDTKKRLDLQKKASKTNLKPNSTLHKSAIKPPAKPLNASSSLAQSSSSKPVDTKMSKAMPPPKAKTKPTPSKTQPTHDGENSQPSQMLHSQMAARAKAQLQASKPTPPLPPSESIDLPDIQSEYSDSDDSDRETKKKALPSWAQSPELKRALEQQSTINPDDIFGRIQPLKIEEVFKSQSRTSRFRARTSSANWTGADRLTAEEERDYAKRMGFK